MLTRIIPSLLLAIFLNACVTTGKAHLQAQVLRGYEFMLASDYDSLCGMLSPDAALHGADGKVVTREQLCKLAEQVKALKAGTLPEAEAKRLQEFLVRRQLWAKRAMESIIFSSTIISGDLATVATLDYATPGQEETSIYTFEKTGGVWKLRKEVSTQHTQPVIRK